MSRELSEMLRRVAEEPTSGPDLSRIRAEVDRRRRRRRGASIVTVVVLATVVLFAVITQPRSAVEDPIAGSREPVVSLLERSPNDADAALQSAANRLGPVDPGATRLWGTVGDFRYGIATSRSGSDICVLKVDKRLGDPLGLMICSSTEELIDRGVMAVATNSVPDHLPDHAHIAVVVPDGYTSVRHGDSVMRIVENMFVISEPPYPNTVTLEGPAGSKIVSLPQMPEPGEAPNSS